jgi:hypothetical protein
MVELNLLNLSVALPMCANTAAASYDSTFGISLVPADYFTSTSGVASGAAAAGGGGPAASCNLLASSSPASARCVAAAGAHCGSASLWGGPRTSLLSSFEAAELAFQLPSPRTANGSWLKTAPVASTGYIMASGIDQVWKENGFLCAIFYRGRSFCQCRLGTNIGKALPKIAVFSAQSNFAEMVQLAKASGMKMIVLLNAVANSGHYAVQSGWNGVAGLASAVKLAHAQGILVGLHTMSASISVQVRGKRPFVLSHFVLKPERLPRQAQDKPRENPKERDVFSQDSYITPVPDPRLAALTGWTLTGAINASTTHIRLNQTAALGWGLGTTLRIGDELITFTSSSVPAAGETPDKTISCVSRYNSR